MSADSKRPHSAAAEEILGLYFPVLDHGFVSLIDYMGTDGCIERAARVSYGYGTRQHSATRGLLRFLRRHKHTTPSEMVELKLHCCMPIFVARQWIRHRTANVNEYSGRYSIIPAQFYTPRYSEIQTQNRTNNQGRSGDLVSPQTYDGMVRRWQDLRGIAVEAYDWMTAHDVARELARIDLPLSTYTQWYWKIDLHNLLHFLTLRVQGHAQWEMREFARVIAGILKRVAPLSFEAWIDYDVCGASMSRMELRAIRSIVKVENRQLQGTPTAMSEESLSDSGLSRREITELFDKLRQEDEAPKFDLDLLDAKSAEYFESRMAAATSQNAKSRD